MILTHGANSLLHKHQSDFILLNNFNQSLEPNKYESIVGSAFFNVDGNSLGYLTSSNVFQNDLCLYRNNNYYAQIRDIAVSDIFTIEIYISDVTVYKTIDMYFHFVTDGNVLSIGINQDDNRKMFIGSEGATDFDTSLPLENWAPTLRAMVVPIASAMHFAFVVNVTSKRITVFLNGVKIGAYTNPNLRVAPMKFSQGSSRHRGDFNMEFVSIRTGDKSNNLESFTVPTAKYTI